MKNTLLITASAAALVAGIGLASAQGMSRDAPAATTSEQKAPEGQGGHEKSALPQKTQKPNSAPTAQAPDKEKPAPTAQVQEKAKPSPMAQTPDKTISTDRQTVGQSPSRTPEPNAPAQKESKSSAAAPMSSEQNGKLRESLKGEKSERLSGVKFSISVGDAVPESVHFYRLPERIVDYAPQYRDFDYILVGDDILIVDPRTHRIVAVISA
jgi:outer membrane biosynthesis protein TonB